LRQEDKDTLLGLLDRMRNGGGLGSYVALDTGNESLRPLICYGNCEYSELPQLASLDIVVPLLGKEVPPDLRVEDFDEHWAAVCRLEEDAERMEDSVWDMVPKYLPRDEAQFDVYSTLGSAEDPEVSVADVTIRLLRVMSIDLRRVVALLEEIWRSYYNDTEFSIRSDIEPKTKIVTKMRYD